MAVRRSKGTFFLLHRFYAKFCFYGKGKATLEVIEVQQGDYLKEDDIVRLRG
ncbi:MAG TPA: hypothetical protein DD719_03900 [Desulfotomaculum sp.]|nr:hypothetical protein [Desulfotomaculum sp.]